MIIKLPEFKLFEFYRKKDVVSLSIVSLGDRSLLSFYRGSGYFDVNLLFLELGVQWD